MTLYATIHDLLGNTLGDGPLFTVSQLSVKRNLDGVGSFSCSVPLLDKRAWELVANEREIRIYRTYSKVRRELVRGIIRNIGIDYTGKKSFIKISGPDILDALTRRTTGRFSSYDNQPMTTIVDSLLSKVGGWTVVIDSGLGNQTAKFGGANVFKSLLTMVDHKGVHIRQGVVPNQIEIGAFGTDTGIVLTNSPAMSEELFMQPNVIQIQKLVMTKNSNAIATRIRPLGAGEGVAAVTLRLSNRTSPYAIKSVVEGGQTEYYIDSPQVANYGIIEKYVTFKEVIPVGNSLTSQGYAANELYDASISWLSKNDKPNQQFKVQGIQPNVTVRPGDKITLRFNGLVMDEDGIPWKYVDVNDQYWVLSVNENINGSRSTVDLDISSIDAAVKSPQQVVVDSIDAINVQNIQVKTTPFMYENTYTRFIEAQEASNNPLGTPAKFRLRFSRQVTDITAVFLRFRNFPLTNPLVVSIPSFTTGLTVTPAAGVTHSHAGGSGNAAATLNVQEDTQYPTGISIIINGVDYTTQLGGPWALTNAQVDVELDITDIIKAAPGGFQQAHDVWFTCAQRNAQISPSWSFSVVNGLNASHGQIEANFNVQGVCQAIIPS